MSSMKFKRPLDLHSALAKINRADQHLKMLKHEISEFIRHDFHRVEVKTYRTEPKWTKCSAGVVKQIGLESIIKVRQIDNDTFEVPLTRQYMSITVTRLKDIPVLDWGTIVGDIVNNLRGALDNLVWALTDAESGPAPYPIPPKPHKDRRWRDVCFPVVLNDRDWNRATAKSLWGIRPSLQTCIKRLQPIYRRKFPLNHWLYQLHEVWNTDKHRLVAPVSDIQVLSNVHLDICWPHRLTHQEFLQNFKTHLFKVRHAGPFELDAEEIARFSIVPLRVDERVFQRPNMQVNTHQLFDMAFQQGVPPAGKPVTHTLEGFFKRTLAVIGKFQSLCS